MGKSGYRMVTSSFSQSIKQHSVNLLPTSRQLPEKPDFIHTGRADNPYTMALRVGDMQKIGAV